MYLPRSMGGPETPPLTAFRVVEELSKADGSVGWCAMIATALSLNAGRLPPEVGRELAGTPADYRGAGSARAGGRAWEVSGGYRVKGRWNFASGIQNANWLYCTCVMMDGDTPCLDRVWRSVAARGVGAAGAGRHRGYLVGDGDAWHRQSGFHGRRCVRAGKAQLFVGRCSGRDRTLVQPPRLVCDGVDTIGGERTRHRTRCDRQPGRDRRHRGIDFVGASVARPADGAGPHR